MNKVTILLLRNKVDKTRQTSHFVHFLLKRKPIKTRIRIWHGTCNIKDEQENRRAGHVKTTESKGNEITKEQARWMYEKC